MSLLLAESLNHFVLIYSFHSSYVIFLTGLVGNLVNLLVFRNVKVFRHHQCTFYFSAEVIANLFQLLTFSLIRLLVFVNSTDPAGQSLLWCKLRGMIIGICTLISFASICFLAFDQYLSTNYQARLRAVSTLQLAKTLVLGATICSILHSILLAVYLKIQSNLCGVFDSSMTEYLSYFYYLILTGLLPILIASFFSICAYRNVRRIVRRQIPIVRRRFDRQLTAMVLLRVICFVVLTVPYTIHRMYIYIFKIYPSNLVSYAVINLLAAIVSTGYNLNHAISFYLFFATSVRFRRQVRSALLKTFCRPCCSARRNQVQPTTNVRSPRSSHESD